MNMQFLVKRKNPKYRVRDDSCITFGSFEEAREAMEKDESLRDMMLAGKIFIERE